MQPEDVIITFVHVYSVSELSPSVVFSKCGTIFGSLMSILSKGGILYGLRLQALLLYMREGVAQRGYIRVSWVGPKNEAI